MKSFILFTLIILISTTKAQETASPSDEQPPANISQQQPFSAVEFFEVIHPDNKRNPNWPEKLTIEPITKISQKEFEKQLKGRWRMVHHCGGAPIAPTRNLFDGIQNGYLDMIYKDSTWNREEIDKPTKEKIEGSSQNRGGTFELTPLGNGRFARNESDFSIEMSLVIIEETNEYGIEQFVSKYILCKDGTPLKFLFVPIKKPIS